MEQWQCELQLADADQAGIQFVHLEGLDDMNLDTEVVSGETTILAEGAVIEDGNLKIPDGGKKTFGKIKKRGPSETSKKDKKKRSKKGRALAPLEPDIRTVLVVRVIASDKSTTASSTTLSADVFGTGKEISAVSMSERFRSCSYGETLMTPYNGRAPSGVIIQDGVREVVIATSVNGISSSVVHNTVVNALKSQLGISNLASEFDHVMLCLPPGTSGGWIAYGTCCFGTSFLDDVRHDHSLTVIYLNHQSYSILYFLIHQRI